MLTLVADNQRVQRSNTLRYEAIEIDKLLFSQGYPGELRAIVWHTNGHHPVKVRMSFQEYLNHKALIEEKRKFSKGLSLAYTKPVDFFEAARLRAAGFAKNKQKDIEHRNNKVLRDKR